MQDATGSTRSQRLGHCSGLCSEGAALHTQPFLRTGQLWDRPQFPCPLWAILFVCSTVAELATTKADVPWTWPIVSGSLAQLSLCVLSAVPLTHRVIDLPCPE